MNYAMKTILILFQELLKIAPPRDHDLKIFVDDGDKAAISYPKFTLDPALSLGA